jgi:hypothetical protein
MTIKTRKYILIVLVVVVVFGPAGGEENEHEGGRFGPRRPDALTP